MRESAKAFRFTVTVCLSSVKGFPLPDGGYRLSLAQTVESIDESPVNALRVLSSKDSKALLGNNFTDYTPESIEIEPHFLQRG